MHIYIFNPSPCAPLNPENNDDNSFDRSSKEILIGKFTRLVGPKWQIRKRQKCSWLSDREYSTPLILINTLNSVIYKASKYYSPSCRIVR